MNLIHKFAQLPIPIFAAFDPEDQSFELYKDEEHTDPITEWRISLPLALLEYCYKADVISEKNYCNFYDAILEEERGYGPIKDVSLTMFEAKVNKNGYPVSYLLDLVNANEKYILEERGKEFTLWRDQEYVIRTNNFAVILCEIFLAEDIITEDIYHFIIEDLTIV